MTKPSKDQVAADRTKLNPGDQAPPDTPGVGENIRRECKGSGRIGAASCPNCGAGIVMEEIGGA